MKRRTPLLMALSGEMRTTGFFAQASNSYFDFGIS